MIVHVYLETKRPRITPAFIRDYMRASEGEQEVLIGQVSRPRPAPKKPKTLPLTAFRKP